MYVLLLNMKIKLKIKKCVKVVIINVLLVYRKQYIVLYVKEIEYNQVYQKILYIYFVHVQVELMKMENLQIVLIVILNVQLVYQLAQIVLLVEVID